MSQIAQVQITFVPGEDRLLMRLSTSDRSEFRFWLTRRFVRLLRPQLTRSLTRQPRIQSQVNPEARRELLNFDREKAVSGSDFRTPFKDDPSAMPLGDKPVLLARFQLKPRGGGDVVLAMGPEQGQGIDLALNPNLLHSIMALLDTAIRAAEWDLEDAAAVDDTAQSTDAPALN